MLGRVFHAPLQDIVFGDKLEFDLPGRGAILQLAGFVGEDLDVSEDIYPGRHDDLGPIL
jgi:hypothetical protein